MAVSMKGWVAVPRRNESSGRALTPLAHRKTSFGTATALCGASLSGAIGPAGQVRDGGLRCHKCVTITNLQIEEEKAREARKAAARALAKYFPKKPVKADAVSRSREAEEADRDDRTRHGPTSVKTVSGGLPTLGRRR